MIKLKRFGFFLIFSAILACIFIDSSLAQPVPINFGEQVVFTNFNYSLAFFSEDPINRNPPNGPYGYPTRTTSAINGSANTSVSAVAGQAGMAEASTGIEFSLNYGSMDWEIVKNIPVLVTLEFTYQFSAIYVLGRGSANAFATYNLYGPNGTGWPAYDNIGFETSSSGTESHSVKAEIWTTYGELDEKYSNKIYVTSLSQAHVVFGAPGVVHNSFCNIEVNRITLSPGPIQISIDIKPGSYPNSINPWNEGKIPVAIMSTQEFHAVDMINEGSLTFGPTGDELSLAFCNLNGNDINGDGILDLVCHFYTQGAGFQCGDTEGILKGETVDGRPIMGSDLVRIIPCNQ